MENQLIQIYLLVCQSYDKQSSLKYQRSSNFTPLFSDQEVMTIYLFGHLNNLYRKKHIHQFIERYWLEWFPALPSYQAFNRRLNLLENNFHALFRQLSDTSELTTGGSDYLIDSMPVMLACGTRSPRARVAPEIANTGFSAVKQTHFYGVRLHLIAQRRAGALPLPAQIWLRPANVHDLPALRDQLAELDQLPTGINLFADKAYADQRLEHQLAERHIKLLTPLKKPKKQELSAGQKQFNRTVSTYRQPIEGFFKWLIDKTDFQRAGQVRSTDGLLLYCIGKLTFALLSLHFYY